MPARWRWLRDSREHSPNCSAQLDLPWVVKNLVFLSRAAPHLPLGTFPPGSGSWGTLVWISNFWSFEFSPAETSFSSFGFPFLPSSLFPLFLPFFPIPYPPLLSLRHLPPHNTRVFFFWWWKTVYLCLAFSAPYQEPGTLGGLIYAAEAWPQTTDLPWLWLSDWITLA